MSRSIVGIRVPTEQEIRKEKEIERVHDRGALPSVYVSTQELIRNLAGCDELTSLLRDDNFAAQFQYLIHHENLRTIEGQVYVIFLGEDSPRMVTAYLRPYGEEFWEMASFYETPTDSVMSKVTALLNSCGYEFRDHEIPWPEHSGRV